MDVEGETEAQQSKLDVNEVDDAFLLRESLFE